MKKHIVLLCMAWALMWVALPASAQPNARRTQQEGAKPTGNSGELSARALARFPRTQALPDDLIWTREIYRTIDLTDGVNGALYYPVEPIGDRMNMFSLIFKLLGSKKLTAYEYQLDGVERMTPSTEISFKDILSRFDIYYQEKKLRNQKDSVLIIDPSDVPSADVQSYFVKEVWYFDQRTSTYGSMITAICPVMHRSETFSTDRVKLPMFWVNYQDLAPYLAGSRVMASDMNHTMNRSMDDFFTTKQYKGDIYKTTNLQNVSLASYCDTDSAMVKEQNRIEGELVAFEKNLYGNDLKEKPVAAATTGKKGATAAATVEEEAEKPAPVAKVSYARAKQARDASAGNSKKKGAKVSSPSSKKSSAGSGSVRASVRRERR